MGKQTHEERIVLAFERMAAALEKQANAAVVSAAAQEVQAKTSLEMLENQRQMASSSAALERRLMADLDVQ